MTFAPQPDTFDPRDVFSPPRQQPDTPDFQDCILGCPAGDQNENLDANLVAFQAQQTPEQRLRTDFDAHRRAVQDNNIQARDQAFDRLLETCREAGQPAINWLVNQLNSRNYWERALASALLRRIGAPALDALQRTVDQPPSLEAQRRAEALIGQIQREAPAGLLNELSQMVGRDGPNALRGERARQIMALLDRCGTNASAALCDVMDNPNAHPAMRALARERLDRLAQQNPTVELRDSQGRMRRFGPHIAADYEGNELTHLRGPGVEYRRTGAGTYEVTRMDGEGRPRRFTLTDVASLTARMEPYTDQFGNPQQRLAVELTNRGTNGGSTSYFYLPERRRR